MKILNKNNDYKAFLKVQDNNGSYRDFTTFDNFKLELRKPDGTVIRTLTSDQTTSDGKLYLYDNNTIKYYLETRDTDVNPIIKVWFLASETNSEVSDNTFNIQIITETFKTI